MSGVADLKAKLLATRQERDYYASLVEAFMEGSVPRNASVQHFILAKWGRRRLDELDSIPVVQRPVTA